MTDEEYAETQQQLTLFASIIVGLNVEDFIQRTLEEAVLAPCRRERIRALRDLAEGASRFKTAAVRFRNEMQRIETNEGRREVGDGR